MSELRNPYVGLRPFFLHDSLHFFGRDAQTAELLAVLRQHRFLGVVGSSGSGKSSLVRAGLLPALFGGFLVGDRDRWRIVQIKPGDTPMRNLAAGLLAASSETPPTDADIAALEAAIRDEQTDAVVAFVRARLTSRESLFLLVDQFEEIFAFRRAGDEQRADAADFVALLMALADQHLDVPVFVTLTMRTDFLGDCDLFYGLPEIMNRGQYLVPRLTRQQLRLAIEGPAMLTGARFAPQLMDLLLNQLGDREDRLPVIQHALLRTWDAWHAAGAAGPIELRHFEAAGGLENALNLDAEAALAEVTAELPALDARVVARLFKALTDTDLSHRAVRRPARVNELMAASGADRATVDTVIRCFSHKNRNFLYADGWPAASDPRVDISHESLIRQWTRLRDWVAEEREMRDQFTALVTRARSWQRYGVVLQGNELKSAEAWWKVAGPSAAWARRYATGEDDFNVAQQFLTSSTKARRRTKVTRLASAAVLVAAVAGILLYQQRAQTKRALDMELLRGMESHATLLLERDPESAIIAGLTAAQAHDRLYPGVDLPVTLEALLLRAWRDSALITSQQPDFDGDADYATLSPDGRVVVLSGVTAVEGGGGFKVYEVSTGRELASKESIVSTDTGWCAAVSPDGGRLNWTASGLSGQWVIKSGEDRRVKQLDKDYSRLWAGCVYSPDSGRLALVSSTRQNRDWILTLATVSDDGFTKVADVPLAGNAEAVTALRFSRSGNTVVLAQALSKTETTGNVAQPKTESEIEIIDARTGASLGRFNTPNEVSDVALTQEGVLVTVEKGYTYGVFLRQVGRETAAHMLPNSGSDVDYGGIAVSADGERLAAALGETARLWEIWTGLDLGSLSGHQRAILAVQFDANDQLITVGQDGDIRSWRAGKGELHSVMVGTDLRNAVMSQDGTSVITAADSLGVSRWNLAQSGPPVSVDLHSSNVSDMALSGDGRILAELIVRQENFREPTVSVRILDAKSGAVLAEQDGWSPHARLALSSDGRRLAIANDAQLKVWTLPAFDAQPFRLPDPQTIHSGSMEVAFDDTVFSPDPTGRQLATVQDRVVFVWNTETGACEGRIEAQSEVSAVAYVPGGAQIVTGDVLGRVSFWAIGPDLASSCAGGVQTPRTSPLSTLQEHRAAVNAITFVADGSRFATASDDYTAEVWDTKTGHPLLTLRHRDVVTHATFSADGTRLMTAADIQGARVWEVPLKAEIRSKAQDRITRPCLTKDERQRFFPGTSVDERPCVPVLR